MTRLTEREAYERKCKRLVKEIWEKELKQSMDEFTFIGFDPFTPVQPIYIILRTDKKRIEIHRSQFDLCFNSKNKEQQQYSIN